MTTAGGKWGGGGGGRTLESARVPGWSGDRKWDGGRQVRSPVVRGKGELRELLGEQAEKTVKAQVHGPDMAICASPTKLQQLSAGMASI